MSLSIVNGSAAEVVGTVPLTTFAGINTLKGGINIYKQVVDENESIVDDDSTFKVQVALDHISESGLQIWFDTYEVDPATGEIVTPTAEQLTHWINTTTGEITETEPTGYKDKVQIIDAEKGIYKNADGVLYGVNGKTPVYANETNYIGTGGYGNVSGYTNVLDIQDNWMIRIVNVLAGTTYEVTETQTNGMQPSYAYWHDNASSDEHIVIGNAASNIRITNKIVNRKIIVYKTDSGTTPLSGAKFTIDGNTLTSGEDGYTEAIELAVSGTPYDLVETLAPDGYIKLENPVSVSVGSSGVTYMQPEYDGGAPQTAERDVDGNYVIQVRNSNGVELPMTGGPGTLIYTLSGLALILASALMYGYRMRRRERRLN